MRRPLALACLAVVTVLATSSHEPGEPMSGIAS